MIKIAPSILSADFTRLGDQVHAAEIAGADYLHVDVMDGHFVPNLTFGFPIMQALQRIARQPLDVHLMIQTPERYIDRFVQTGAHLVTVHVETCPHLHRTIGQIHEAGARAGVALNPATPLCLIEPILADVDLVSIMSVNPGFGGQKFIPKTLEKVRTLRQWIHQKQLAVEIEIDGGIDPHTAPQAVAAGAQVLVAGSAIFNDHASIAENIAALRASLQHL